MACAGKLAGISIRKNTGNGEPIRKVCVACGTMSEKMDKCMVCKLKFGTNSYYCTKACQKIDWSAHRTLHLDKERMKSMRTVADSAISSCEDCSSMSNLAISQSQITKSKDEHGLTCLMAMAQKGNCLEVERLLKSNADPSVVDD